MSTKVHVASSTEGILNCILSVGQRQDCRAIQELWKTWQWSKIRAVVADKGYDSSEIRNHIKENGSLPVIPYRSSRWSYELIKDSYDKTLYSSRNFIERLFCKIKENKRIATRFDKIDVYFSSFIALSMMKAFKLLC